MDEIMTELGAFLPFLIPLAVIQLALMITALIHALKNPNYKVGNKTLWIVIILFVNIIGPVLYFVIGKGDGGEEDDG